MKSISVLAVVSTLALAPGLAYAEGAKSSDTEMDVSQETTGSIAAGQTGQIDADSDGSIDVDELTAVADLGQISCHADGIDSLFSGLGTVDEAFAASADDVRVVQVANCESADVEASLGSEESNNIRLMLSANDHVTSSVQAEGGTVEDILRAGKAGDMLVVFIPADPVDL